jgi:large subunit ribosomal protein L32
MAVPKRKSSKGRRDSRRSAVSKLSAPAMVKCPNCHEYTAPHKACDNCGFYDGKEVLKDGKLVKESAKTEAKKEAKDAK